MPQSLRLPSSHTDERRHLPAHETPHSSGIPPTVRNTANRGRCLAGRGWLWSIPARSRVQGLPSARNARRPDRLEIPARSGTALLSRSWCPNSTSDSVISNYRWILGIPTPIQLYVNVEAVHFRLKTCALFVSQIFHHGSRPKFSPPLWLQVDFERKTDTDLEVFGDRRPRATTTSLELVKNGCTCPES